MSAPTAAEIARQFAMASDSRLPALIEAYAGDPRVSVRQAVRSAQLRLDRARAERERLGALYHLEVSLRRGGCAVVAGVDEVGRGALAGPLTVAAVVLPGSPRIVGLDDSKRLTPERRQALASRIRSVAVCYSVSHVSPSEIDTIGIGGAVRRGMGLALQQLEHEPDHVLVDGLPVHVSPHETAIVKGDGSVAAIAAASVVAKVARDELMRSLAADYPEYGFDVNKGYGTTEHIEAIARHGVTPLHRRSFAPCDGTLTLF